MCTMASGAWARFYTDPAQAVFADGPTWASLEPVPFLTLLYRDNLMMHPAAWLVPRAIVDKAGPWHESLSLDDDGEYFARVVLASKGVAFCREARSYYRSGNESSLSHLASEKGWRSQYLSIDLATRALLAVEDSPETRRACANRFQRFVYSAYPAVPDLCDAAGKRAAELGGSEVRPLAGPMLQPIQSLLGWRIAKRLKDMVYGQGYRRRAYLARQAKGQNP